jgi:hypothetical protein
MLANNYSRSQSPSVNEITGTVDAITFRGRFTQVWLAVGDAPILFEYPGDVPFELGQFVTVPVSPRQLLVYES